MECHNYLYYYRYLVKEVLSESISNSIRLANSLKVYENLPKWIKNFNDKN